MNKRILLFLFYANLFLISLFWWVSSDGQMAGSSASVLIALGRLAGLYAVYFLLLQFLMMSRSPFVERAIPFDELTWLHRTNGKLSLTFILLHPLLLTFGYAGTSNRRMGEQFLLMLSFDEVLPAALAVILFVVVVVSSVVIARRKLSYELWYGVHLLTYLAMLLAWGHQLELGIDFVVSNAFTVYWYLLYVCVFGQLLIFRILKPLWMYWHFRFSIQRVEAESETSTSVYISGRGIDRARITPGQFLIVRFMNRYWWQAHPFSLSGRFSNTIRITVKQLGDFTHDVPSFKPGTSVIIDGPHGGFTLEKTTNQKLLFIAGGIGITPIRMMLEQAGKEGRDAVLLYGNKFHTDVVFRDELSSLSRRFGCLVHYVMSDEPEFQGEKGYVDREKVMRLVPDVLTRDIFLCGPPLMMAGVTKELLSLGVSPHAIHSERFSF